MSLLSHDIIFYQCPTGALVSVHDYSFLSTSQQKQCKPVRCIWDILEKPVFTSIFKKQFEQP